MSETDTEVVEEQREDESSEALAAQANGTPSDDAASPGGAAGPDADVADDVSITPAEMSELVAEAEPDAAEGGLDNILDIPVTLAVEIGSTQVSIRNLLQFNQGSVVELDRLAGEPLDIFVNGTLIAHGEVVVVNEKFGIRLTDVVSAHERVRKLQ